MIVIRLYPWSADFRKTLDTLKNMKNCCDEIWLGVYGYVSIEEQKKRAAWLTDICAEIKAAGIRPVLEFGSNFGHVPEAPVTEVTEPFEKMVGLNGKAATGAFCPRGKNFLAYEKKVASLMSKMHPWGMYIDDDLRMEFRNICGFGCFCDRCIAEFNKKYGTDYDREELARRFVYDADVRKKYIYHNREAMHDYAYMMAKEVAKENPDILAGWENCFLGAYNGEDFRYVFDGLHEATGNPVMSRSGAFVYNDHSPRTMLDKVLNTSYQNSILPEFVTIRRPEIENTDDFCLGKSIQGTCTEATLNMALGCTGVSFHMCGTGIEPMSFRKRMWKAFGDHRDYWNRLAELNRGTGTSGLMPAYFPDVYEAVHKTKEELEKDAAKAGLSLSEYFPPEKDSLWWAGTPKEKGRELLNIGLPISYEEKHCGAYILCAEMLDHMSDKDIRHLLSSNVLTDGNAIMKLWEKGYGDMLPAEAKTSSGMHFEYYTDDEINGEMKGQTGMTDQFVPVSFQEIIIRDPSKCRILAVKANYPSLEQENSPASPSQVTTALLDTSSGGKWAVVGSFLWGTLMNTAKRYVLFRIADYLTGGLAAYVKNSEQIAIFPRTNDNGEFVCATLQSITIGDSAPLTLTVRKPAGRSGRFILAVPGKKDRILKSFTKGDTTFVKVPSLRGWHCCTVISE